MVHAREERQVADADVSSDLDFVTGVHREGAHAVDIARLQPGVVDCGFDRLAGESELTAPGLLRELGLAHSGDRRLAAQAHFSAPARSGPRSFLAAILTRARLRRLISRLTLAPVLARSSLRSSLALAFEGSFLGSRSLRSSLVPRFATLTRARLRRLISRLCHPAG